MLIVHYDQDLRKIMEKRTTFAKRLPLGEGHEGHEVKKVSESSCVSPNDK
jgi:hypothetical protein